MATKKRKQERVIEKKGRGNRKCRICNNPNALLRRYRLNICRKCFREKAEEIGFKKYD